MKARISFVLAAGLFLVGCGDDQSKSTSSGNSSSSGGSVVTAPVDYLGALGKAKVTAEKTVDTAALSQAVQMFNVQEGRYPKNLEELVEKQFIPKIPDPPYGMKIIYNSGDGSVKIVKQ